MAGVGFGYRSRFGKIPGERWMSEVAQNTDNAHYLADENDSELRDAPRFPLLIRTAPLISSSGEFLCEIRDASASGVCIRTFHPLPQGVQLTLDLPNGDKHAIERVW